MAYKPLKLWFDDELAVLLSSKLKGVDTPFDESQFIKHARADHLHHLELKDRVEYFADLLEASTSGTYIEKNRCFIKALGPKNHKEEGMFKAYYWIMPIAKWVEKYGLDDFKTSMNIIEEITKRNTGEYAIRPFIEKYRLESMNQLYTWSKHPNKHVRRLCSEGPRPRLPWAKKLSIFIEDPSPLLPILEALKDDNSRYVQKSVANCINDILKDNPAVATSLLEAWSNNATENTKWIIKHAVRNLRKKNDGWALQLCQF
jgi:3-methyladenine DNA glycosylase AlkC